MAIPKEILEIERPVNTVVKASRTPDVYSVVKRTSKRIPGKKNPQPIELGVIGKIAHGRYIPNPEKPIYEVDFKIYGPTALCHKVGQSIYDDLLRFYQIEDAIKDALGDTNIVINADIGHIRPTFSVINGALGNISVKDNNATLKMSFIDKN